MDVSRRKSATKFVYVNTVHKWLVGDVPFYLKFSAKITYSPGKNGNSRYLLVAPSRNTLAKRVRLSLIGSRGTEAIYSGGARAPPFLRVGARRGTGLEQLQMPSGKLFA